MIPVLEAAGPNVTDRHRQMCYSIKCPGRFIKMWELCVLVSVSWCKVIKESGITQTNRGTRMMHLLTCKVFRLFAPIHTDGSSINGVKNQGTRQTTSKRSVAACIGFCCSLFHTEPFILLYFVTMSRRTPVDLYTYCSFLLVEIKASVESFSENDKVCWQHWRWWGVGSPEA